MEYAFIVVLYIIGVGWHVNQRVDKVRERCPTAGFRLILATYFSEEWNTLFRCFWGLLSILVIWYIIHYAEIKIPVWIHDGGIYLISIVAGYSLHRIAYKILGTFEGVVEKKIIEKIQP